MNDGGKQGMEIQTAPHFEIPLRLPKGLLFSQSSEYINSGKTNFSPN